ncbi:hypothetical protein D9M73_230750 [compost metagenome]
MSAGSSKPLSNRPSLKPGSTQWARAARRLISVIICRSLAHRLGRRFGSKDTLRPASRMRVINSNDICRAVGDRAGGMPVACRCRALSN